MKPLSRSTRPRALTSSNSPTSLIVNTTAVKAKHNRATSEMSISNTRNLSTEVSEVAPVNLAEQASRYQGFVNESSTSPNLQPKRSSSDSSDEDILSCSGSRSPIQLAINPSLMRLSPTTVINNDSAIEKMYDDHEDRSTAWDFSTESARRSIPVGSKESGASFDELVDRLLSLSMSKSDSKFKAIFLCLYRKFAAPSELTSAIIYRFDRLSCSAQPDINRINSQLRYLSVFAKWISDYPGDFAHPLTRQIITSFLEGIAENRVFAVARKEMNAYLDIVTDDDDTEWACSDSVKSRASRGFLGIHTTTSMVNPDSLNDLTQDEPMQRQTTRNSASTSMTSTAGKSGNLSTGSFQTLLNSVESAQRQAQLLTPIPRNPLTKIQWRQFIETPEEDLAKELTRIDWIMFSSIRPRDLIRHVSLPVEQKEKCKSLENVNRMIDHFNHVAFWVANLILLRDKAKHRAKALEKFMGVAWVSRY